MTHYTLLSGATGLVGRYLLRDLSLNGQHLAVLVRASRRESAEERVEGICQHWEREIGKQLPRPVVLTADISQPFLGLSEADQKWIGTHCHRMIHSAAILEFFGKDREREPWKTNFGGTKNVLQLCESVGITDLHYISTAYVAGLRESRIMEDDLDQGQSFRNDYEESKFEAEMLVRQAEFLDRPTVYRPAVIAGDYNTGYTNTYHGIYLYLRLLAMLIPEIPKDENGQHPTPIKLNMTGRERRNIIPVDWVSAVTSRLLDMPEARGKTFHLAPDDPMTARNIITWCAEYFNTTGYEFCGDDPNYVPNAEDDAFAAALFPNITTYKAYERTDNTFDLTNLQSLLPDLPAPCIDKTTLHRWIEYGEQDKWGKRRAPKPEVAFAVDEYLSRTCADGDSSDTQFGLDVSGPGGGHWTVSVRERRIVGVETGLPVDDKAPVLRLPVQDFAELCSTSEADLSQRWEGGENAAISEQAAQALFPVSLAAAESKAG